MQKETIQPTVEAMNEVIAIFMGWKWQVDEYYAHNTSELLFQWSAYKPAQMKYHSSWDWIIPAIAKIPQMVHAEHNLKRRREMSARYKPIENELCNFYLSGVHYCLYQFITWYNKQTNDGESSTAG